ncbi:25-hydroxyvitamin D-1 alpha hydroxylase, mitochondrial isoform X1 [Leucoraja erinacea]|uniref:25-hydroxyvitamin D-1 alpha hydroxylase, mitochondrial isoform X1 n=2 Tax=Leucoraja erinaceus TaxID=7782 RepID=UPI002453C813|nr:25-hydroxyvitamin D-1 alpha hydroxylase, mitochondrial isoform X1 [Leucoraja erinacea]
MSLLLKLANRFPVCGRYVAGMLAKPVPANSPSTLADMPGPSAVRFAYDLFFNKGISRLHELQLEGKAKYGPVWKARFGPILTVHIADPALIEQVLRQEGQHPIRSDLSSWKDYRQHRGHAYGLLTAEGEEWQELRSTLSKHMLKPKQVAAYDGVLNNVITDLVLRLRQQRASSSRLLVRDLAGEFYKFGLEGISAVLFETRIGCLKTDVPKETEDFIQSINTMFQMTLLTMAMPKFLHKIYPGPWQTFVACWDYMFAFAKGHIDRRMVEVQHKLARSQPVEGTYLTYFLSTQKLPMRTIYGNVTELLLAGVDTISSTMSWSLYELARHPDIQAALHREIRETVGDKPIPSAADVAKIPLLKAVVKEILRLYPVIPGNARVIPDKDIQIGEYIIPQNTLITLCHYATSRDKEVFPNPDSFQPMRWLHKDDNFHPYASIPFGFGKRSCIGRRIAELEVYLALARILTHFEVRQEIKGSIVKPMTRTVLVPEQQINLQFIDR